MIRLNQLKLPVNHTEEQLVHKTAQSLRIPTEDILELDKKRDRTPRVIEEYRLECWHCGNCRISCPCGAISFEFPLYTLV